LNQWINIIAQKMDLTNLNRDRKTRRKSPIDISTMVYGKVPPQAKDLEEAVSWSYNVGERCV
jgi:hypothetical protein